MCAVHGVAAWECAARHAELQCLSVPLDAPGRPRAGENVSGACAQGDCTAVPDSSRASQYFCATAASAQDETICAMHDTISWCRLTSLLTCPAPQPFSNGDCTDPANLVSHFGSADAADAGIYYGPSAICLGVPGGALTRGFARYSTSTICVAAECADGGVVVLIRDATGSGAQRYPCPEGDFVDLGLSQAFAPGVRCCLSLLSLPRAPFQPRVYASFHHPSRISCVL